MPAPPTTAHNVSALYSAPAQYYNPDADPLIIDMGHASVRDRMPRVFSLFSQSTITIEAMFKFSTPIPFCQFPGSPCEQMHDNNKHFFAD